MEAEILWKNKELQARSQVKVPYKKKRVDIKERMSFESIHRGPFLKKLFPRPILARNRLGVSTNFKKFCSWENRGVS